MPTRVFVHFIYTQDYYNYYYTRVQGAPLLFPKKYGGLKCTAYTAKYGNKMFSDAE